MLRAPRVQPDATITLVDALHGDAARFDAGPHRIGFPPGPAAERKVDAVLTQIALWGLMVLFAVLWYMRLTGPRTRNR